MMLYAAQGLPHASSSIAPMKFMPCTTHADEGVMTRRSAQQAINQKHARRTCV
jgi:hypothetical protein